MNSTELIITRRLRRVNGRSDENGVPCMEGNGRALLDKFLTITLQ